VRKVMAILAFVPLAVAFMAGCSGNGHHITANDVPIVLTIEDQPPAGLTVVSFTVQITGVVLQGGTGSQSTVSLLSSPVTINLSDLQTMNSLLASTSAPAGTYSGIMITFANASMTVLNNSNTTFTDGSTSCPPAGTLTTTCTLAPTFNPTSTTVTTSPFPITLTSGTPVNIGLDFNSSESIANANGTLSIAPSVTVTTNTTTNATTGNLNDFTNATGQVTAVGSNQFTVTDTSTGQPITLGVSNSTTFNNFNTGTTCTTANTFACIQKNQIVSLNFGTTGAAGSTPTVSSISLQNGITQGVQGTVIGVNPNTNTLQVVITSVSPAFATANSDVKVGQVVNVNPGTSATFSVESNGQTIPSGLNFASINNVAVGQSVVLDSTGFTAGTGGANGTLTTDQVMLAPTQFGGTINSLNSTNQTFTINGLNGLFTTNGTQIVNVDTGTTTSFTGVTGGFTGLMNGNNLAVGGLLFETPTGPVLVGQQINVSGTTVAAGMTGAAFGNVVSQ
jgi:hypothetical protein